jgi:hypothetical protein
MARVEFLLDLGWTAVPVRRLWAVSDNPVLSSRFPAPRRLHERQARAPLPLHLQQICSENLAQIPLFWSRLNPPGRQAPLVAVTSLTRKRRFCGRHRVPQAMRALIFQMVRGSTCG